MQALKATGWLYYALGSRMVPNYTGKEQWSIENLGILAGDVGNAQRQG